jgi:aspartate carbamoyltransferase catalytic subunit
VRHFLGIEELSAEDLASLLDAAAELKRAASTEPPRFAGGILINLFFESSTRTRVSFEIAGRRLGLDVVNWTAQGSSHEKGESLLDTAATIAAMGPAAIVLRHPAAGAPWLLASHLDGLRSQNSSGFQCAVINAGDGAHEHPSQALLDALTLRDRLGTLRDKTIAIVGDLAHSRVARSNVFCLTKLGARVRLCGPAGLRPLGLESLGPEGTVSVFARLEEALAGVDAVMALRIQRERLDGAGLPGVREYHRRYGLTPERLVNLGSRVPVLHPGPLNRGVELTSGLADGPQSAILSQVENGVPIRMAILRHLLADQGSRPRGKAA